EGLPRRPPTRLRPGHLCRPQRGRAVLQPAQTVPRTGHSLCQTRRLLPSRDHHRGDRVMAAHRLAGHALARSYDPAMDLRSLLQHAAEVAGDYRASLPDRPVQAPARSDALLERFGGPLPRTGTPPERVVDELV